MKSDKVGKTCFSILILILLFFTHTKAQPVDLKFFFPDNASKDLWLKAIDLKTASDKTLADSVANQTFSLLKNGIEPEAQLMVLNQIAAFYFQQMKDFDEANKILQNAKIDFLSSGSDTLCFAYADYYNTKGLLLGITGKNNERHDAFTVALNLIKRIDEAHEALPYFLRTLMQSSFMMRKINDGFVCFDALIKFTEKKNDYYYLAETYMAAGNILKFYNPELSALFFDHVLLLSNYYKLDYLLNDPFFYISLGSGHTANNNHKQALDLYFKGLELLYTSKVPDNNDLKNSFYYYIGVSYKNMGENEKAILYLDSALNQSRKPGIQQTQNFYRTLNLMGLTLNNAKRFNEALPINLEVLQNYLSTYGKHNTYFTQHAMVEVSRSLIGLQREKEALIYAHTALCYFMKEADTTDIYSTPIMSAQISSNMNYLELEMGLYNKINIIQEMFKNSGDTTFLKVILNHYDFVMKVTDWHASVAQSVNSIYDISSRYKHHSNKLFDFLAENNLPDIYWQDSYLIGAKSKSYSLLLNQLQQNKTDQNVLSGVSENKASKVNQQMALKKYGDTASYILVAQERLLLEKEEFLYKMNNPVGSEKIQIPQLAETRHMNLFQTVRPDELIIDYYLTKKYLHSFYITENTFNVQSMPVINEFDGLTNRFFRGLRTANRLLLNETSEELTGLLLNDLSMYHFKTLVVVPDEQLWVVPFEVLTKNNEFLGLQTSLKYRYTSHLFRDTKPKNTDNKYIFKAFAPVFDSDVLASLNNTTLHNESLDEDANILRTDRSLSSLPASVLEVENIAALFRSANLNSIVYMRQNANKETYMKEVSNADILHIATHGLSHTGKPELSGLFLYGNTPESQFLFVGEVLTQPINANLVVLSACQSGYGTIMRGEGVMGISKSFMAAGAKNVVASLWKVHDEKTARLMEKFYTYVLQGLSYEIALQKAKIDFIDKGELPIDWASFILIEK